MAPWLRDENGNDVFDGVNSPFSGSPIFDPIDVSESLGSAFGAAGENAGAVVDTFDSALRGVSNVPGMPGATSDAWLDLIQRQAELNDALDEGADGSGDDGSPWNISGLAVVAVVVVAALALYLLAPVLELITEIIDE